MTDHTPGPWTAMISGVFKNSTGRTGMICDLLDSATHYPENREANVRLIAAAPELLAACEQAQRELSAIGHSSSYLSEAIAKAKAKGEA